VDQGLLARPDDLAGVVRVRERLESAPDVDLLRRQRVGVPGVDVGHLCRPCASLPIPVLPLPLEEDGCVRLLLFLLVVVPAVLAVVERNLG